MNAGEMPEKFQVSIGGFTGRSYSVTLVEGALEYQSCERGYSNLKTEIIDVTDERWGTFRATIDALDIWSWEKKYAEVGVCDGTQWGLEITYADKALESEGSNSFPGEETLESEESEEPTVFDHFLEAVQSLVGGRDFA